MDNLKIKSIIIDDDVFTSEQLADKIRKLIPALHLVKSCENALEGIEAIKKFNPALVFLDIRMPGLSGFDMLDKIDIQDFEVIFITSYNEYAIRAIRYSALDYLLKPIQDEELTAAINRFLDRNNLLSMKSRLQNLMHNISTGNTTALTLLIPTRQGEKSILVSRIIRCEADSNYTHFILSDNSRFTSSRTLKEYESVLNQNQFVRVHKSHIINVAYVKQISNDHVIHMKDDSEIEISRRRLQEVMALFRKNQEEGNIENNIS